MCKINYYFFRLNCFIIPQSCKHKFFIFNAINSCECDFIIMYFHIIIYETYIINDYMFIIVFACKLIYYFIINQIYYILQYNHT